MSMPLSLETANQGSINSNTLVGKPTNGNFTTAYTSAKSITCSNLPSPVTALTDKDIVAITQYNNAGACVKTFFRDQFIITVAANVITFTSDLAVFASTDTFIVLTNIPNNITSSGGVSGFSSLYEYASFVLAPASVDIDLKATQPLFATVPTAGRITITCSAGISFRLGTITSPAISMTSTESPMVILMKAQNIFISSVAGATVTVLLQP